MDIRVVSTKQIPCTNIRECDLAVVPHNSSFLERIYRSLGCSIRNDTTKDVVHRVEFCFNRAYVTSSRNLMYFVTRLMHEHRFDRSLNAIIKRIREFDPEMSSQDVRAFFQLLVDFRFLKVLGHTIFLVGIRRKTNWDFHFAVPFRRTVLLADALVNVRPRKFLVLNLKRWKVKLLKFLRRMHVCRIGCTDVALMAQCLVVDTHTLEWSLGPHTRSEDFMRLPRKFDLEAVLVWHLILLRDYFERFQMEGVFKEELQLFFSIQSEIYLKHHVLQSIPDMWERSVPEKYKKKFTLNI